MDTVFSFDPITIAETISVVKTLRRTSPGIDEIPMSLFIDNIDVLADIITHICNQSLKEGIFPEKLAVAIIICRHKKRKGVSPGELSRNLSFGCVQ